jgi:hypothetical protein
MKSQHRIQIISAFTVLGQHFDELLAAQVLRVKRVPMQGIKSVDAPQLLQIKQLRPCHGGKVPVLLVFTRRRRVKVEFLSYILFSVGDFFANSTGLFLFRRFFQVQVCKKKSAGWYTLPDPEALLALPI